MRKSVPLDDELAAVLSREAERTGRPFRDVVNDVIRRGLVMTAATRSVAQVPVFDLGPDTTESPWDVLAREDADRLTSLDPSLRN